MLDIVLAGSGGMIPLPDRWLSSLWVEYMGKAVLTDCGEGTQIALKKAGCKLSRLELLLITHFHADHTAGIPGLMLSLGNCEKKTPLIIAGPPKITEIVRSLLVIAPCLPFPIEYRELRTGESGGEFQSGDFYISSLPLKHGAPCLGYSLTVNRKPIFNPHKAEALKIPKHLYKTLHAKESIELDGRIITPDMVLDGDRKSYKVSYITDTRYFNGIDNFVRGSDIFFCEGMHGDEKMRGKLSEKGHMVFSDSAKIAKDADAGRLVLTHLSPAFLNPRDYLSSAKAVFPNTEIGYDGMKISL